MDQGLRAGWDARSAEAIPPGYTEEDAERFATEPPKGPVRSAFARDRARVLHSAGFRRLAAKTQVLVAGESDFPRTRLTHTLEVAQIARELGTALGADPDLTDMAGLAHDLGHPPFGHNGEGALDEAAASIGGFEGNAQTFRMLTRLEAKIIQNGRPVGLNLTRASLDGAIKYPWLRGAGNPKFSCYPEDTEAFEWVRAGAPGERVSFEAQIMDWSDDVAYSVHDVEDGVQAGHIDVRVLGSVAERDEVAGLAHRWYAPWADVDELSAGLERISLIPPWPSRFDGGPSDLARLKELTSRLTGRFVASALLATKDCFGASAHSRYAADLVVEREIRCEVAAMKALADLFVFQRPEAEAEYERQRTMLLGLVQSLLDGEGAGLDAVHRPVFGAADSDAARLRVVIDQVASLTDQSALRWHRSA